MYGRDEEREDCGAEEQSDAKDAEGSEEGSAEKYREGRERGAVRRDVGASMLFKARSGVGGGAKPHGAAAAQASESGARGQLVARGLREQAQRQIVEADRAEQIIAPVSHIRRGADANLPGVNLSGVNEAVMASIDSIKSGIAELRADAADKITAGNAAASINYKFAFASALQKMGCDASIFPARNGTYNGRIISTEGNVPDKWAVMRISANQAIIFQIADIAQGEALLSNGEIEVALRHGAINSISELREIIVRERAGKIEEIRSEGQER